MNTSNSCFIVIHFKKTLFLILVALCLTPWVSPAIALLMGLIVAQTIGQPFSQLNSKATGLLLKISVVGLGFGMNMFSALEAGKEGFIFTVFSIFATIGLGLLIGKLLGINDKIVKLISSGTAICGGSAIAAVSPIIRADEKQISVSLGIVFILNSVALFVFAPIGHWLELSQEQFGLWSAIAIHDTSSVVGAAASYGEKALEIATTVKLARALWIIPLSLIFALVSKGDSGKIKIPYFIGFFILAMVANTYLPPVENISPYIVAAAKAGLTLTLFLIGAALPLKTIKSVGVRPLLLGLGLWIFISVVSLVVIDNMSL